MSRWKVFRPTVLAAIVVAGLVAVSANASGTFVEPGVQVLYELDGASHSGSYGWAVSQLRDVNHDGATDFIVGEPFDGPDFATGTTYVYSGRTGALLHRYDGEAGDWNGFAMADAGDTNGDASTTSSSPRPETVRATSTSIRGGRVGCSTASRARPTATRSGGVSRAPAT